MIDSLWGEEFNIEPTQTNAKKIINKIDSPKNPNVVKRTAKSKSMSLEERLRNITQRVYEILGKYKENTVVIKTKDQLVAYIDKAIENGVIAIDTETNNSLDPISCKLMGPCIYTPGMKNAYIPINHIDIHTGERLSWQLTEEDILEQFSRLSAPEHRIEVDIIVHNGKFDYQVLKCTTGYQMKMAWDTLIGAKILNENEQSAGLKQQYIEKIDPSIQKYDIEHLFADVEYAQVDPEIFALYAATDSFMTYKLYEWQKKQFEKLGHERLYWLFLNVEMPIVEVAAEMELTGIEIDKEYGKRLSAKYHKKLEAVETEIANELQQYSAQIAQWRLTTDANYHPPKKSGEGYGKSKNEQLEDPVNIASPSQLAILLYDVLKHPIVDKKKPRGTGEDILEKIDLPICKLILKARGILKLISTYIDKLPSVVSPITNRLHAHFNQLGAGTGRFSSSDPNLQNIPSHEKSIRMLFKASDGCVLVGSDFSQQEPRLLSNYSQDENMINAYKQGKDLYATIASGIYKNDYWDNMEKHQDGSPNPDGKKRRSSVKSLMLGIMYGMGPASLAEAINGTVADAQRIIDDFYEGFPKVKQWIDETYHQARTFGYVEDSWGRRRRLPDVKLPKYTIKIKNEIASTTFNPLLFTSGRLEEGKPKLVEKYEQILEKCRGRKEFEIIKEQALLEGVELHDNSGYISQAERQCVNARVQGGAATMSKKAMINVYRDKVLKDLGFKLLIAVHDELIGECPIENQDAVADRLTEIMRHSADDVCNVPFKCDATIETVWYETDYSDVLVQTYKGLVSGGMTTQEAFDKLCQDNCECTPEKIREFLDL